MINGKSVLALVPARGGSKGLPGKNIRLFCGKPLVAWAIEAVKISRYVDRVIVSTDSPEIAEVARAAGADVPFIRPADLASDTATSADLIEHALSWLSANQQEQFEYVALIEPTSPLREASDVDRMLAILDERADTFDSITSVGATKEHPTVVKRVDGEIIRPFIEGSITPTRRQDESRAFFPYGIAYIFKARVFLAEKTVYTARCTYFEVEDYKRIEIDDIYDFVAAEAVMRQSGRAK